MSPKLHIDFMRRRPVPWLGIAALALSAAWLGYAGNQWLDLAAEKEAVLARMQDAKRQQRNEARKAATQIPDAQHEARQREAMRAAASLRYPWPQALSEWEGVHVEGVVLLSVQHDQAARRTQIELEARDVEALLAYVRALNEVAGEGVWSVLRHQLVNGPVRVVRGSVASKALARPSGPNQ